MKKIAVIGGGGREHALIQKLSESPSCDSIVAIPGNGGIASHANCVSISATDIAAITQYCVDDKIDYVVVAPDDPLALGLVDALEAQGIPAFGPTAAAAQIESSKIFAKELMQQHGIPTASYQSFSDMEAALTYLETNEAYPIVVKADGLALGKGVLICQNEQEAVSAVRQLMQEQIFGDSGAQIVIEEFLIGPEISVLVFCDGKTLVPLPSCMDHKRALDGDRGPNTGGMGVVSPNPVYTDALAEECFSTIFLPTVRALSERGTPFKGCLYFGLMATQNGPKVIEYNCRFGDPETQAVLPLLESDLLEIMLACTEGRLLPELVKLRKAAAACIVLASGGYPESYAKGLPITGLEDLSSLDSIRVCHAGTVLQGETPVTSGGRVLSVTATAATLREALDSAYQAVGRIHFDHLYYRKDIGQKALDLL